jgi:hypothetical protein
MRKRSDINSEHSFGWPTPEKLRPYFLSPPGERWFFQTRNDTGFLAIEGLNDTDHLPQGGGRIDIRLEMYGHPDLGIFLYYLKTGGERRGAFSSKGDLTKLREWVRTLHNDPMPVGLFIPYADAWLAVKEFIKTDGELPKCIEWVANSDLPPGTFPDP